MRVSYHPDFPKEIKRFQAQYSEISEWLAQRFRLEVENAIERIKASPNSAGHFLNTGSKIGEGSSTVQSFFVSLFHSIWCFQ